MQLEDKTLLHDIRKAAERIIFFTHEKVFSDYQSDDMLRAAVERKFEIIGEALNGLRKTSPELASKITQSQRIIAFRNILIHGYAQVDNQLVWSIVQEKLSTLLKEVIRLLEE